MKYQVLVLMGSDSDFPIMEETVKVFEHFSVEYRIAVASAHRTPERVTRLVREAEKSGAEAIIAGAGMAAHLAGFIAAHTLLPVIGVPLSSSSLDGLDALLSTVQMPPGIPVATMSIGKPGARNAAIFVLEMLAVRDPRVRKGLSLFRQNLRKEVEKKDRSIRRR